MIRARFFNGFAAAALAWLAIPVQAQTPPPALPFTLRVQQAGTVTAINDAGLISFNAEAIGRASNAQLGITYTGAAGATVVITNVELTGSTDFAVTGVPDATQSFRPTESFGLGIRYTPTTSQKNSGLIKVSYTESPRQGNPVRGTFSISLAGVAPEFTFSYFLQPNGNSSPITSGGTITFPPTDVLYFNSVTVVITNRGSGPGSVRNITLAGADFTLSGLPLLPVAAVDAGKDLRFTVSYEPFAIANSTGSTSIEFIERTVTFNLRGNSIGPVFSYDVLGDNTVRAILPGETVSLPDAIVSEKSSVVLRVRNTGNAEGPVKAINVAGTGFSLVEQPFLPISVLPDGSFTVTVGFAPTAPGRVQGRLRVGTDEFLLTGNGLGPTLTYAYVSSNVTTSIVNNGSVNFPPIAIGQSSTLRFVVTNTGTAPGAVNSVSITTATGTPLFTLADLPGLPANIGVNESLAFSVTYKPTAVGSSSATLKVDTLTFTLSGAANQPPALPQYRFTGSSGAQEPATQAAVSLSLASAYPMDLSGTLTLAFNSEVFSNDPAVQFAVGGRTVTFTIPAGRTDAVFQNSSTSMRLQTGTVAGTISLTPSFTTTEGGINLTPTNPPPLNLTVAQSAPRLLNVQLANRTANSFQLLVTGYATGRSITQIDVTFTPTAGENVSTTRLSLNVESSFSAFYQTAASTPFGSQFTATLPFTLAGDVTKVTSIVDTLQSASVTLINRQGSSTARSVELK